MKGLYASAAEMLVREANARMAPMLNRPRIVQRFHAEVSVSLETAILSIAAVSDVAMQFLPESLSFYIASWLLT